MKQLFVDLDGVLADFDTAFEKLFKRKPNRSNPDPEGMWDTMRAKGDFFASMPVMPEAYQLWFGLLRLHPNPIILTGAPPEIPDAAEQKRAWVRKHFGCVNVIADKSKNKCLYAKPGDVLLDDWTKYQHLWVAAGGTFVHYLQWMNKEALARTAEALA